MPSSERTDWFKRCIDVLTLIVVAGGFWAAIDQAKKLTDTVEEAQRSSDLASWNNVSQQWLAMDSLFISHPDARAIIWSGKDVDESDPQYPEDKAIAAFVLDFMDYAASLTEMLNDRHTKPLLHPEGWASAFMMIFKNSPMACRVLHENELAYSGTTRNLARNACLLKRPREGPPT
jgi:hypothetical protein